MHARHGAHAQMPLLTPRCVGMQRLEVLVTVMLARERRPPARRLQRRSPRLLRGRASDSCTELAAALATLPSGLLEMVAVAVAGLGLECRAR